jgi:hypothetical protein
MRLDTDGLPMRTPLFFLLVLALLQGLPARSTAAPAMLCDAAAQYAASKTGVPLSILRAVTLAETGRTSGADRQFAAWPWAIQSGNRGDWFSDADAALSHVKGLMAQGISNIDIGCFQLNLRWHGEAFGSLQDMISPQQTPFTQPNSCKRFTLKPAIGAALLAVTIRVTVCGRRLMFLDWRRFSTPMSPPPPPKWLRKPMQ